MSKAERDALADEEVEEETAPDAVAYRDQLMGTAGIEMDRDTATEAERRRKIRGLVKWHKVCSVRETDRWREKLETERKIASLGQKQGEEET